MFLSIQMTSPYLKILTNNYRKYLMEHQQQDFSAIDKHIAWEQYKKEQLLNRRWAENWLKWVKVVAILIIALGILFLLITIGIYILKKADEPIKHFSFSNSTINQKDIELVLDSIKQVETKLTEIENKTALSEKEILQKIRESETPNIDNENLINTSFTVFETIDTIVTGRVYSPDNLLTPENQYCYMTTPMEKDPTKSIKQDLAFKKGSEPIIYEQRIDAAQTALATDNCKFIDVP